MSWDIVLLRAPPGTTDLSDMPPEWIPEPLGSCTEVAKRVRQLFPDAELDEDGGYLWRDGFRIQFQLNTMAPRGINPFTKKPFPETDEADEVIALSLEIRGNSNDVVPVIRQLAEYLDIAAVDTSNSRVLQFDGDAEASFKSWRDFRNQLVGSSDKIVIADDTGVTVISGDGAVAHYPATKGEKTP